MVEIQDRIRRALGEAGTEMAYDLAVYSKGNTHMAQVGIPAPLGGGIFITWLWNSNGALLPSADGLEFEAHYRRANSNTPPVDMLMARCVTPEYAAAVARAIHAEQIAETIRHGHKEFTEAGLFCPTCLDLGHQALPELQQERQTDGSS